jgi:L-fuculose-phosphate aldolase
MEALRRERRRSTVSNASSFDEQQLRNDVVQAARSMWEKGYVSGTVGNVSARLGDTDRLVITPSGAPYASMQPEDLALCSLQCEHLAGEARPSMELAMHAAVYRARPDVGAIVHSHAVHASAIAVCGGEIPFLLDEMAYSIGPISIPTAAYAPSGTPELAENVVAALGSERMAILLANHGTLAVAPDVAQAFAISELTERAARIYILAKMIGDPKDLTQAFKQK